LKELKKERGCGKDLIFSVPFNRRNNNVLSIGRKETGW